MAIFESILTGGLAGAVISGFFAMRNQDKSIKVKQITEERQKWRERIRELTVKITEIVGELESSTSNLCCKKARINNCKMKLRVIKAELSVSLNPKDDEDKDILTRLQHIIDAPNEAFNKPSLKEKSSKDTPIEELQYRLSLLLKHDWERVKNELEIGKKIRACFFTILALVVVVLSIYTVFIDLIIGLNNLHDLIESNYLVASLLLVFSLCILLYYFITSYFEKINSDKLNGWRNNKK